MSDNLGVFSLMLHAHMPYCRKSGTWPAGEEWLFEAMNETYIPLLSMLRTFQRMNKKPRMMIGIVPILAEQLADPYMNDRFCGYMEDKINRAERDINRYKTIPKKKNVAEYWKYTFEKNYNAYKHNFFRNLLGTFKWLQEENLIELVTSAATHGFLPLMENDSGIYSQIQLGIETYEKYFGKKPKGFWLPECAYRPKIWSEQEQKERRSIDDWLAECGINYFFVENIGIEKAQFIKNKNNESNPSTYRGYQLESGVYVFGRNSATGKQVWSPEYGYPGDPWYREFHIKDPETGLQYMRVTGSSEKEIYEPNRAFEVAKNQANHFVQLLRENLIKQKFITECSPIIESQYDCELFGHWWLEGVQWIENLYTNLFEQTEIEYQSLSDYISNYKDSFSTIRMNTSTWGENGDFTVWNNPEHKWIWPYINSSTKEFEEVLQKYNRNCFQDPGFSDRGKRIMNQTARELLLMEGSDWPFLLYTQQAKEYANKRFHHHHQRFNKLIWAAKEINDVSRISDKNLEEMEDIDNPWKKLDINLFRRK